MLESIIHQKRQNRDILLMTHLVLGYPSFSTNRQQVRAMAEAGVELIELQIPFSEPTADGPVILKACSDSLKNGTKVAECIRFADEMCKSFPEVSFLLMTYYNIVFVYGEVNFITDAKVCGVKGFIIPDLPPEEAGDWLAACDHQGLDSIFIFTPTHTDERLREIATVAKGFVYCVGRRGVTGKKTEFDTSLAGQIDHYRRATRLPLALGFGVRQKSDVDFLVGKVDVAIIGSKLIEIQEQSGVNAVKEFLLSVRNN